MVAILVDYLQECCVRDVDAFFLLDGVRCLLLILSHKTILSLIPWNQVVLGYFDFFNRQIGRDVDDFYSI